MKIPTRISAVGPFVMLGVRSLLVERVSMSAEIGFSALYQWTTQSNSNSSTYARSSGSSNTTNTGSVRISKVGTFHFTQLELVYH